MVRVTVSLKQNQSVPSSALIPSSPPHYLPGSPAACFSVVFFYQLPPQGVLHVEFSHYHYKITVSLCLAAILWDHQTSQYFFQSKMLTKNKTQRVTLMNSFVSEKNILEEACNLELSFCLLLPFSLGLYLSVDCVCEDCLTCWDSWGHSFKHHQVNAHMHTAEPCTHVHMRTHWIIYCQLYINLG